MKKLNKIKKNSKENKCNKCNLTFLQQQKEIKQNKKTRVHILLLKKIGFNLVEKERIDRRRTTISM